ncbi:MAG: thymidine phosphorylase family protein [Hyphomonadaceae bacterium]
MDQPPALGAPRLRARRLRLQTQDEAIVLMRSACHLCKSEGLSARARVLVRCGGREVIATLYQTDGDWLSVDEIGLSEAAWRRLELNEDDPVAVGHAPAVESLADVRRRAFGDRLDKRAFYAIISDIVAGRYVDIHLATFLTACSTLPLDINETSYLTEAMVESGERLTWAADIVSDKHCVGGLPGNRTTPIVVAIAASCGLIMPKTSSRAITSPSGTADAMETLAPVQLDIAAMRRVVEAEGACIAWGGGVKLSPADDVLIRMERALDIDPEGQLIASVLSKKLAAGASHVVFDLPVGPTAKVRTEQAAHSLAQRMRILAQSFRLEVNILFTDGSQPVGRGIGPALEARDVLAVLDNSESAPTDLRDRSLAIAAALLELTGVAGRGEGFALAKQVLGDGQARSKFERIREAQGGVRAPPVAPLKQPLNARRSGIVTHMNNRKLSRLAKLAGAPDDKSAGIEVMVKLGDAVSSGQPLALIHAETPGELDYALGYALTNLDMVEIES